MKRTATFTTELNSRAAKLLATISENEELETVLFSIENNAIGDTVIVAYGRADEIKVLRDLFNCAY